MCVIAAVESGVIALIKHAVVEDFIGGTWWVKFLGSSGIVFDFNIEFLPSFHDL